MHRNTLVGTVPREDARAGEVGAATGFEDRVRGCGTRGHRRRRYGSGALRERALPGSEVAGPQAAIRRAERNQGEQLTGESHRVPPLPPNGSVALP